MNNDFHLLTINNGKIDTVLTSILNFTNATIAILDPKGCYLYLNHVLPGLTGLKKEDMMGKSAYRHLPKDLAIQLKNNIKSICRSGDSLAFQNDITCADGIKRSYNHFISPVKTEEGTTWAITLISTEITGLKTRKKNHPTSSIADALDQSAIVFFTDKEGKITKVNNHFCQLFRYTEFNIIGKKANILNSGVHPQEFWTDMWHTLLSGDTWRGEVCNRAANGKHYWIDTVINPIRDEVGEISQFLAINQDITEKKNTELEIHEKNISIASSEEELRANLEELQVTQQILEQNQMELKVALAHNVAITNALDNSALISITDLHGYH